MLTRTSHSLESLVRAQMDRSESHSFEYTRFGRIKYILYYIKDIQHALSNATVTTIELTSPRRCRIRSLDRAVCVEYAVQISPHF